MLVDVEPMEEWEQSWEKQILKWYRNKYSIDSETNFSKKEKQILNNNNMK